MTGAKNIETKWLYGFLTLEACRHSSQAVEERNLSQSTFSRRIKVLESTVGVLLFNRTTNPLQLTEGGELLHSQTRSLLQQLECNLDKPSGRNLPGAPNIKIAVAHSLSLMILPRLVYSVSAWGEELIHHIGAIDVVQAVNALREGKGDFIISFHDEDLIQSSPCGLKVFESELYPVCAVGAQGKALPDVYQPQTPILNYASTPCTGRLINRHLAEAGNISACALFMFPMGELSKNTALGGHSIAWLPARMIVNELWDKRPVCLDTSELVAPTRAYTYRMDTRSNKTIEHPQRILYNYMPEDLVTLT